MARQPQSPQPAEQQPQLGSAYEPVYNAARETAHKVALQEWQIKQDPGAYVRLANGAAVRIQPGIAPGYPGEKAGKMLGNPEGMLLNPKPPFTCGPRYQWRVRTSVDPRDNRPAETANLSRAHKIRFIEESEINPDCPYAVYTELSGMVTYQSQVLCEIMDPNIAYEGYKAWEDLALYRQRGIVQQLPTTPTVMSESGSMMPTHVPGKTGVRFHEPFTDQRSVADGG